MNFGKLYQSSIKYFAPLKSQVKSPIINLFSSLKVLMKDSISDKNRRDWPIILKAQQHSQ